MLRIFISTVEGLSKLGADLSIAVRTKARLLSQRTASLVYAFQDQAIRNQMIDHAQVLIMIVEDA